MHNLLFELIAVLGVVYLFIIAFSRPKQYLLHLLAIKPFIDLTVNIKYFGTNALEIVGVLTLAVVALQFLHKPEKHRIYNMPSIILFLSFIFLTYSFDVLFYSRKMLGVLSYLVRYLDAFLIYFIADYYLNNDQKSWGIIKVIWISTLLQSILNASAFFMGYQSFDLDGTVSRFRGFYNDAGAAAYMAIISVVFGTLYYELRKKSNLAITNTRRWLLVTFLAMIFLQAVMVTKSAALMLFVFLLLWFGVYHRKILLILPALILSAYNIYQKSEAWQLRMKHEVAFMAKGFNRNEALSMGHGRVARWDRMLRWWEKDFTFTEYLFGKIPTEVTHNQYLHYLFEFGFIGLALFIFIYYRFARRLWTLYRQNKNPIFFSALVLLTIYLVYSISGHPFDYTTLLWYLMILLSSLNCRDLTDTEKDQPDEENSH